MRGAFERRRIVDQRLGMVRAAVKGQCGLRVFGGQAVARKVDGCGQRDVRQSKGGRLDLISRSSIQFAALETRLDGGLRGNKTPCLLKYSGGNWASRSPAP